MQRALATVGALLQDLRALAAVCHSAWHAEVDRSCILVRMNGSSSLLKVYVMPMYLGEVFRTSA